MSAKIDKLILTNFAALGKKYDAGSLNEIRVGINGLIQADKRRGLDTQLIGLDDEATLQGLSVQPVKQSCRS